MRLAPLSFSTPFIHWSHAQYRYVFFPPPIGFISFSVPMCFKITPTKNTPYRLFWKWVKNTVRKNFHSFFQRHLFSLELFMEVVVCFFK